MKTGDKTKLIEIFAGTPWQAGMVKSLLADEGIEAYLIDEIIGTLTPWWTAPGGAGSVKVIVAETDLERAIPIVKKYESNLQE